MIDPGLRRADELISELVEIIETARAVPMSSSCVVGRETVLDILDDLRDVIPPEMSEARRVLAQRDELLRGASERDRIAREEAEALLAQAREGAEVSAETVIADARHQAARLLEEAEQQAREGLESARTEQIRLVSATSVHHAATEQAQQLHADADAYARRIRREADSTCADMLREAQRSSAAMRTESTAYADRELADLLDVLARATTTAQRGREEIAARRARPGPDTPVDGGDEPREPAAVPAPDGADNTDSPLPPIVG